MPAYKAPVQDTLFLLTDVFDLNRLGNLPRFAEAPIDTVEAVLSEAGKFAEEVLQPLNAVGDREGCKRHDDGSVTTPKGFKEAYKAFAEGGWVGISGAQEYGGQGLPHYLGVLMSEYTCAANQAFAMYPGLTNGAAAALMVHANDEIKQTYLPKLVSGEWTGTMNLTEPHCGTDLGLIKTRATRNADGSFAITGAKIFISSGEHDLSRQHRPSRARPHRGRACGDEGHLAVRRPEIPARHGRAQRPGLRLDRAQDGHPRQFDLRDELRRGESLAGWRGKSRPQRDVRDDERRAPRRRRAGPRAIRGRLSERGGLCEGAPARPFAHRGEEPRQARRPAHRASRRAAHAARNPLLQRSRPRADGLRRALRGRGAGLAGRRRRGRRRTTASAC